LLNPHTPELIARQLEIAVCRLADDLRFGQDASPYTGAGIEYVQSRPFQEGDSVHDIDWRVTARTGRFHVKDYEALKSIPLYLVVDTSASMAFSSQSFSKSKLARILAGGLALAGLRRLSPVGLLAAGARELHYRPTLLRGRVFQWLHALETEALGERTVVAERLDQLSGLLSVRTLIVVISDLYDPGAVPAARRLAQQHDVIVLHLEDPAERGRLRGGFVQAAEAETGRTFVAGSRSLWFADQREPTRRDLAAAGIDYLRMSTDRPFVAALRRLLVDRGGLMRNRR
jgi:uncharacterized protein (DUF58 family)